MASPKSSNPLRRLGAFFLGNIFALEPDLHSAILADGFIDEYPQRSAVSLLIESLPSASTWQQFVKQDEFETDDSRSFGPHHR